MKKSDLKVYFIKMNENGWISAFIDQGIHRVDVHLNFQLSLLNGYYFFVYKPSSGKFSLN